MIERGTGHGKGDTWWYLVGKGLCTLRPLETFYSRMAKMPLRSRLDLTLKLAQTILDLTF